MIISMTKLPQKVENWIKNNYCPQRLILSGNNTFQTALQIASKYQNIDINILEKGLSPDCLILKDEGISFKIGATDNPEKNSVRGLIKWISQKPLAPYRIVILENFERASRESPQALLKILEEPPTKAFFIFTTQNHYKTLPTILSRMTVLPIPQNTEIFTPETEIKNFLENFNLIEKFKFIEDLDKKIKKEKSKIPLKKFIAELLQYARNTTQNQKFLPIIVKAESQIKKNINTRLILENLALELS